MCGHCMEELDKVQVLRKIFGGQFPKNISDTLICKILTHDRVKAFIEEADDYEEHFDFKAAYLRIMNMVYFKEL